MYGNQHKIWKYWVFIVNLVEGYFKVPERWIVKLNNQLDTIQSNNYKTTAFSIAKLTGTIVSMGLALGPIGPGVDTGALS